MVPRSLYIIATNEEHTISPKVDCVSSTVKHNNLYASTNEEFGMSELKLL